MDTASLRVAGQIIKESAATGVLSRALQGVRQAPITGSLMGLGRNLGRSIAESPTRTALLGAGVGAAHGYATRGEGESGSSAALRGGLRGAAIGGGAGLLGRRYQDTRLLDPSLSGGQAIGATAKSIGRSVKNFGARQLHGLTGAYADRAGDIGLRSSATAEKEIDLLRRRAASKTMTPAAASSLEAQIASARSAGQHGDAALAAGITSVPGVARGLTTAPGRTLRAMGSEIMSGGRTGAMLGVGLPVAMSVPDLARGDESATGGRSMRQKLVGLGSGVTAGALTSGLPVIPQIASSMAFEHGANRLLGGRRRVEAP